MLYLHTLSTVAKLCSFHTFYYKVFRYKWKGRSSVLQQCRRLQYQCKFSNFFFTPNPSSPLFTVDEERENSPYIFRKVLKRLYKQVRHSTPVKNDGPYDPFTHYPKRSEIPSSIVYVIPDHYGYYCQLFITVGVYP